MCLGHIKGAFLEAGPLKERYRPLFAHQPQGGIPGVEPDSVIEIIGNVYGLNDAPFEWWQAFDQEARALGFQRSQFDSCVYFFRCAESNALTGILGAHVDDSITWGEWAAYALSLLKKRFPYRKWRVGSGEFCGVQYVQDPETFEISFVRKSMRPSFDLLTSPSPGLARRMPLPPPRRLQPSVVSTGQQTGLQIRPGRTSLFKCPCLSRHSLILR